MNLIFKRSIGRGESGNLTFASDRVISRGNTRLEGVQTHNVLSTYFWEPVSTDIGFISLGN